jgi:UDP-N-acetyl-D-mannosaminuronic acid dehydrogenase
VSSHVAVIGAGGHVGLGLSLLLADVGHRVVGIDVNREGNAKLMAGEMPFYADGAAPVLQRVVEAGRFVIHDDHRAVAEAEIVIIIPGTPVDANLNPDLQALRSVITTIAPHLRPGQLLILRSTIAPGTTEAVKGMLDKLTGLTVGRDLDLVVAPERVVQGQALHELPQLPQLIGAFDDAGYRRAEAFFLTFVQSRCHRLTPVEAELGKLMTNMARYVQFALANEYYLLASMHGANVFRIIDACNDDYPRLNLPGPGPNVGGPCLYKDGWFLLDGLPFSDIIATAFRINDAMPAQIRRRLQAERNVRKVAILGLAFKAGSDDTRNSLSLKMGHQLEMANLEVVRLDPHVPPHTDWSVLRGVDAVILMTPHPEFADLPTVMAHVGRPDCLYADLWGLWPEMRHRSDAGFFRGTDVPRSQGEA